MPKVTEEHRQSRRSQILEAALNCFARNGFHQTSMRDICKEAGLSAGAVYLHFPSKEDIIEESWKRVRETRLSRFEAAKQANYTQQALNELLDKYRRRLTEETDTDQMWQLGIQLQAEALWNPRIRKSTCENWDEAEKNAAELIRYAAERGVISPDIDYEAVARLIIVVHDGLMLMKILDPERDLQRCFEAFKTLLTNYNSVNTKNVDERRRDDG